MQKIAQDKQGLIVKLRRKGHSIPEISRAIGIAKTTVQRYVKHVEVPEEFTKVLREKQGGSKQRAAGLRENTLERVRVLVGNISQRDRLFLLLGLYWGEGTKGDFSMINSDPILLRSFLTCIEDLGIQRKRIRLYLRVHSNISLEQARDFWTKTLNVPYQHLGRVEIIEGKKEGKLQYGMCRVRVLAGIRERLLIQTAIGMVGKMLSKPVVSRSRPRSSTDRTSAS